MPCILQGARMATAQLAQPSPVSALRRQSSEVCLAIEPDARLLGRRPLRRCIRRAASVRLIQIPLQHFDLHHQVDHLVQLLRGCRLVWNASECTTLVEAKVRASASRWDLSGTSAPPACGEPARANSASLKRQGGELWRCQDGTFNWPSSSVLASAVGCEGRRLRFPDTFRDGCDDIVAFAVVRASGPLAEDGLHRSLALIVSLECTHRADQTLIRTGHER